ncbi:hypothetical protein CLV51_1011719 [Chitinophaga niastensis]|uniref:Uncharacterized protein n=2 Tax=Chitinophaga niastensis TaxID=536980 RepID=A0A2P8HW32_CHINA|nr:hypothetical protein CLV51_1011719 [Chitinophaga niastensis]
MDAKIEMQKYLIDLAVKLIQDGYWVEKEKDKLTKLILSATISIDEFATIVAEKLFHMLEESIKEKKFDDLFDGYYEEDDSINEMCADLEDQQSFF